MGAATENVTGPPGPPLRCTWYAVTPTSSVEAYQVIVAVSPETDAATPPGTLGAWVSPVTTACAWADGALELTPSEAMTR